MSWTTPRTWVTGEVLSKTLLDAHVRDNLAFLKVNIALESAVELTIASGAVTKTCSHHTIDTESNAALDNLDTINGGAQGEVMLVRPADGARTVALKHATGNIWNPALTDILLDDAGDYCFLIYDGSNWCAISGGLSLAAVVDLIAAHAGLDTGVHGSGTDTLMNTGDMIDEDDMASNLDTKVPTQQSVKAYVESKFDVSVPDYCFVNVWVPTDYGLFVEDGTGEVAVRGIIDGDATFAWTIVNGFLYQAPVLYVWK